MPALPTNKFKFAQARASAGSPSKAGSVTIEPLLRQVHNQPRKPFLFVDDLLCALLRAQAPEMFALVALFFCAPISWKKAIVWCGWEINFAHDTIQLMQLVKLEELISQGTHSRPSCPKERSFEKRWSNALGCSSGLDGAAVLHSPPGSMHSIQPAFRKSLNKDLRMSSGLPNLWLSAGSKILEVAGAVRCLDDIPRIPTWVRIADPNTKATGVVSQALSRAAFWQSNPNPDRKPWQPRMPALKRKAWAKRLGSHILANGVVSWDYAGCPSSVALLSKPAQRYIACFETLAQRSSRLRIATLEAGTTLLACPQALTTRRQKQALTWPLQIFVRLVALSLEWVSQMNSIPPGTLLTLVRPGNLVLRRIRNLKRCVQA